MNIKQLARRIPDNVRQQRILTAEDPIANAKAVAGNQQMLLLFSIWFEFIEPNGTPKPSCPACLQAVLDNFQQMRSALVELENENELLNMLP